MGAMSSISVALSGIRAAQSGLSVTGNNVTNSSVAGYTRQQAIQKTATSITIGNSNVGSLKNQIGLGTDVSFIRQIRSKFYDITYRDENSSANYYSVKYNVGNEISEILGELESKYSIHGVVNDVWNSINDLIQDPAAIETRSNFIQSCLTFVDRAQDINNSLFQYQMNINQQVKSQVDKINDIVSKINTLNMEVQKIEADGVSRANGERDEMNALIDELSGFIDIEVKEVNIPGTNTSRVDILTGGQELLSCNVQNFVGLRYVNGEYPFYEPVFTSSKEVLPAGTKANALFQNIDKEDLTTISENTRGSLKALIISRGSVIGNYSSQDADVSNYTIPKLQKQLDTLVHNIVTLINDAVSPLTGNKPADLNGNRLGTEVFVRKNNVPRVDAENPADYKTLYTTNNIEINPLLLNSDGYNLLAFSPSGDKGDTTLLKDITNKWKTPSNQLGGLSIDTFYKQVITDFATNAQNDINNYEVKATSLNTVENNRFSLSGVSLDEELSNMLKYQHAYNAAAKVINMLDSMLDKVINETVR